jgi:hypothetical protein
LAPPSMSGGMMGGGMGMGMEGGMGYDDGGSVAGSAMTFMDGANRGGMTSQYGLPKYPHQAKPDPRRRVPLFKPAFAGHGVKLMNRFMVQRGKADVYLD